MAKSYARIQQDISELQKKAEAVRQKEVAGVVKRINTAIRHYGIAAKDLDFSSLTGERRATTPKRADVPRKASKVAGKKVAPKYRDDKGNTWAARGSQPRWLREAIASGKTLESFAV